MAFPFYNLGDLIDRTRDPDAHAVIDLAGTAGPRTLSYRALDALAGGVAQALARQGLARGARIGILAANRVEFLAVLAGAMRAGVVPVPVNFKFPAATIEFIMRDAEVELVFCDPARRASAPAALPVIVFGPQFENWLAPIPDGGPPAIQPHDREVAVFLYTSGSTGRPKGVMLSHQSHLWVVKTRLGNKDWAAERLLIAAPLYHMNALALAQLACAGHATVILMPQFDARGYIDAIDRYRPSWLTAVPPMMAMMLAERDTLARARLDSVRSIRMGSAPVSPALHAALVEAFPRAQIMNAYGTTEAGPVVFGPHPAGVATPPESVGHAHPEVALRLNSEGVLEMKCPALMNGYHNLPEATARALTADGYYITGDVFRRDDRGFYYFTGRTDDMFVSGGENIYPTDVERMLERHPAIRAASVVAVPDALKGTKPVAFVVLREDVGAKEAAIEAKIEAEIKAFALANAPAYQHPRRVWIVERLPLSGTNKVDRRALTDDALARLGQPEERTT